VHLAGALGKKCFVLLPFVQDWRWGVNSNSSYWYESVNLFKQTQPDNWQEVFDEVYAKLK